MKRRRHWYFITTDYCVLCGRTETLRERRYGRKPKRWTKRHEDNEFACSGHFL